MLISSEMAAVQTDVTLEPRDVAYGRASRRRNRKAEGKDVDTLFGKLNEIAIERLREFEPPEGYYVAYSGGKDSDVILDLVRKSGVKYDAHHHLTTADPPEVVWHVKKQKDVTIERPPQTMWQLIRRSGMPPRRNARYCCRELKERGGDDRLVITGVRREESSRRGNRRLVEQCFVNKSKRYLNLIIEWTTTDVWQYINSAQLAYCSLYDENFRRLGCVLCPMRRDVERQLLRWPKIASAWERAIKATYKPGGAFSDPEAYWHWWLDRDASTADDDQMVMFL